MVALACTESARVSRMPDLELCLMVPWKKAVSWNAMIAGSAHGGMYMVA